jgi:cysteine desulfurase/selenocysteine lyase
MLETKPGLMDAVRDRFAHVDSCPFQGPRAFFENAGGALTLKSAVETSTFYAGIPDNQGRANVAAAKLMRVIARSKDDAKLFLGASSGQIFAGESGTELLFRLIRTACVGVDAGRVIGSTMEHPATRSAMTRWAGVAGLDYTVVAHDDQTGSVNVEAYRPHLGPDLKVATIIHTSPVTGMAVDVGAIAHEIRAAAPECIIIVDGIQHVAHGGADIDGYDIDGYVISPYKVFARHGYGLAWVSDRLGGMEHDNLMNGPEANWEFGTRDTGAYATFSDVVRYFEWLGGEVSDETEPRAQIEAAGRAIHAQEKVVTDAMLHGVGNQKGLADMPRVGVIGGLDNPLREGLVSLTVEGMTGEEVVAHLNEQGVRTHTRKADHYSGNVLTPLGLDQCVRVSACHYNSTQEVAQFLTAMRSIAE